MKEILSLIKIVSWTYFITMSFSFVCTNGICDRSFDEHDIANIIKTGMIKDMCFMVSVISANVYKDKRSFRQKQVFGI